METENVTTPRDPEDRVIDELSRRERKEKMLDKTIADSFPASDPLSSIPDPDKDSFASVSVRKNAEYPNKGFSIQQLEQIHEPLISR